MVSKTWRSIYDHIAAAIRGWKNRNRTDMLGDNPKRSTSHRYVIYARRRYENDVFASITIADMQRIRTDFARRSTKFVRERVIALTESQMDRALHCLNAHRSEIFKLYRHIANEI
jgi:hypothetical protein